jgi:hypothetical protein
MSQYESSLLRKLTITNMNDIVQNDSKGTQVTHIYWYTFEIVFSGTWSNEKLTFPLLGYYWQLLYHVNTCNKMLPLNTETKISKVLSHAL